MEPDDKRKAMIQKGFDTVATGYDHPSLPFFPETAKRMIKHLQLSHDQSLLDITASRAKAQTIALLISKMSGSSFVIQQIKCFRAELYAC